MDKRKKSWTRRAPRVTGVSVVPEKLSWGPVYAQQPQRKEVLAKSIPVRLD